MEKGGKISLTICTVSFGHRALIERNLDFVKALNPDVKVEWVVVENTPQDNPERFKIGRLGEVKILEGVERSFTGVGVGSQHHGVALNLAMREVDSRYVLVLDPDFYIVRKNWIKDVINHMVKNRLTFFGAPYNPKRYLKYRYFPCVHCMFIDLHKIDKGNLDFSPQYSQNEKLN